MISLTSPVETRAHRWPAGLKLAGLCVASTGLFLIKDPWVHAGALAVVLALYAAPGGCFCARVCAPCGWCCPSSSS